MSAQTGASPVCSRQTRPRNTVSSHAMPFCEADPRRLHYFEGVACPPGVRIPTEDPDAYQWYPPHRGIYNKLALADAPGRSLAPHGITPPALPVFSLPIVHLSGMGLGI